VLNQVLYAGPNLLATYSATISWTNNRLTVVVAGGFFMIVAALLMQRVCDPGEEKERIEEKQRALSIVC
jgi:hypothetical protein